MKRILTTLVVLAMSMKVHAGIEKSLRPVLDRPNFVIIFIDDMGYGDIGPFGSTQNQTPELDQMANEGMKLTDFYVASPVCTPSRASLMTGCYPQRVGLNRGPGSIVLWPGDASGLNPEEITIAEILKERGYATGCFGKWHLGDQPEFLPPNHGFDTYFGVPYSNDMWRHLGKCPDLPVLEGNNVKYLVKNMKQQANLCRQITEEAVTFIKKNAEKPFFCYIPHTFVHLPRQARPEFMEKATATGERRLLEAQVEELDWSTGVILQTLRELKLEQNTIVIFTSDNGPPSHGGGSAGPFRGMKGSRYEGGHRVPCIAWWPGMIPAGRVCEELATTMDLLPTFATLAGTSAPTDRVIDGKDIWPLLSASKGAKTPHDHFFYQQNGNLAAVRSGDWKLITNGELYNLNDDVAESKNVAKSFPEKSAELRAMLDEFRQEVAENMRPVGKVETSRTLVPRPGIEGDEAYLPTLSLLKPPRTKKEAPADKTLVSWVILNNPDVRAGSILTLQDGSRFDGIIFAEREAGKWMAGSDFSNRTEKNQAKNRKETADNKTLLQMAIVYKGDRISIYRNAELYASYPARNTDFLSRKGNNAVFGLRREGGAGSIDGSIEDARIYSKALTVDELKALEPNKKSDMTPYAWWDFEGEQPVDRSGRYTHHQLLGDAKLANGMLVLGPGAALVAKRNPFELLFENSDFECGDLRNWSADGDAFDVQPVQGDNSALRNRPAEPQGTYWIGTYEGQPGHVQGDAKKGTLRSVDFTLKKKFVNFMVGGGRQPKACSVELWVDGRLFCSKTGTNAEKLELHSIDVSSVLGTTATIIIKDDRVCGWGHINADWFVASDQQLSDAAVFSKNLKVDGKYLLVPVTSDSNSRQNGQVIQVVQGRKKLREFRARLPKAGEAADWTAFYPVDEFLGETITLQSASELPAKYMKAADQIKISDTIPNLEHDYQLPYRNQFHFSTRRGWNNDVNGLVYHDGVYHLYYQYNPFNIGWDNIHWGHATSTDLIHWTEQDIALFQNGVDDMMFSGGGFMDNGNTSGVSTNGTAALYVAFTSTGRGECMAYSLDGGFSFTELPENPVVKHRGRDPKIIWHEPTQRWIMVVFDYTTEIVEPLPLDNTPELKLRNCVAFYSSSDLRAWTFESHFVHPDREAIHECPELFEIAVEGHPSETHWIYYGVENRYFIGQFDGHRFVPEWGPLPGEEGINRAAQLFSDAPDGRKIQLAWARHGLYPKRWPHQQFSQGVSLPKELTLRRTSEGLRLFFYPVKEVDSLRGKQWASVQNPSLEEARRILNEHAGKLLDVVIHYTLESGAELTLTINGQAVSSSGSGSLRVLSDRTLTEAFVNEGQKALSFGRTEINFDDIRCGLNVTGKGQIEELIIYEVKSIWKAQ